jgi:hypothetical protein
VKRSQFKAKILDKIKDIPPEDKSSIADAFIDIVDEMKIVPTERFITCGEYFNLDKNDPNFNTIYRFKVNRWDPEE